MQERLILPPRLWVQARLVTALRPNVTLEFHDVAGRIDQHETLMFVHAIRKSNHGAHQELDAQFLNMVLDSGKVFAVQKSKA